MYQVIKLDGFLEEVQAATNGPYARKFCFFLGAGASVTSGIPAAAKLVDLWDEKIRNRFPEEEYVHWKNEKGIDEENKYHHYSDYYEKQFSSNPVDGYNFLEKKMKDASPSGGYACLAFLLTQTPHKVVVTTNFDRLTEDAVTLYAHEYTLVVGHVAMAHYITSEIARPTVVKIHHDLLLDPKSKNADLQKLDDRWQEALSSIFSKYHPIFIGFAGNDPDVMRFLTQNADRFLEGHEWKRPYWTVYKSETLKENVKDFLNQSNAFLIRNNGFDDLMAKLASALQIAIPLEKEYEDWAKNQYNKLQDAIANVQEGSKASPGDNTQAPSESLTDTPADDTPVPPIKVSDALPDSPETPAADSPQWDQDASDTTLYLRAVVLHNDMRYQESLNLLQELIRRNPNNARYRHSCGVTLHKMGRYEKALAEMQEAVALEPDNARYHDSLSTSYHELGKYKEALAESQKALELEPDNARYYHSCGVTFHKMGRYEEALAEKQKAVALEPDNAGYHNSCGVTLYEMGRYEEALAEMQKAVALEPDNARYHHSCGVTLHEMGRYEEALAEKQKAVALEPDNARYHHSCGVTLHKMGQYEEALAEMQKAVALEPDNARHHHSCGVTLHEMGRYEEALAEKQKAVALEPDNARYHHSCGVTLHEMGRYEEALAEKQKAVALEPDNARYHHSCGVTLHKMGRYEEALAEKQKAVALEPDNAGYHNSCGVTLYAMERCPEAVDAYKNAIKLDPKQVLYYSDLAQIYKKMGREEDADQMEEKAKQLQSNLPTG